MHKNYLIEIQRNEKAHVATLLFIRTLGNKLSLHWPGRRTTMEKTKKQQSSAVWPREQNTALEEFAFKPGVVTHVTWKRTTSASTELV